MYLDLEGEEGGDEGEEGEGGGGEGGEGGEEVVIKGVFVLGFGGRRGRRLRRGG